MNHDYETGVSLRFHQQNLCKTLPSGEITMTSYPVGNKTSLSRKPCVPDKRLLRKAIRKSWSLSELVMKNCQKRPLAEKSWWRHIRLAIKTRYLGNHASQIRSYYGTLSGSHGRSSRTHHVKSPEAPPGNESREITMKSHPACNKTSLSWKPCMVAESYYGSLSWSIGRLVISTKNSKY